MAKLGFKDIIMKYLKKDEEFKLKYVDPLNKKNFHISYRSKGEAEAKMAQLKRDGVKDIQITQEDAPANATGTAVAGTGDDSSTVVVKKKKELQKKLMTRMGITETINRTIPDLEYPKDEIRERADQLKELASKSEVNTDTYADSKKKMLNKEETELVEFTLADYRELESDNQHDIAAKKLIDKFGTPQEKSTINDINRRHAKTGYISGTDFRLRTMIVNRYYSRLK